MTVATKFPFFFIYQKKKSQKESRATGQVHNLFEVVTPRNLSHFELSQQFIEKLLQISNNLEFRGNSSLIDLGVK